MKNYNFLILQKEKELNMTQNQLKQEKSQVFKNARWEQLYKLVSSIINKEQYKQNKLKHMREEKEQTQIQENLRECTFKPKLNKTKLKEDRNLLERNDQWTSKRENKISSLQQKDFDKEQEMHTFSPKLNDNYRAETETAEKVILHSNSYVNYVERVRRGVTARSINKYKTESCSDTAFKSKLTSPKKHPLYSDKQNEYSNYLTVKSLKKPLNPDKFSMVKSFSRNKLLSPTNAKKRIDSDKIIFNNKKIVTVESLYENQKNALILTKPTQYTDAVKLLHEELHSY